MDRFVRFWGVRGSISSPGQSTLAVGGNTSCVEVRLGRELVILDGGTGLRELGASLCGRPRRATFLFTHLHWDHIQGLPFFAPFYQPAGELTLMGPARLHQALKSQMSRPTFPVSMEVFAARLRFETIEPGDRFELGDLEVATAPLHHPGGAIGYRLSCQGRSVVYACDHECGDAEHDRGLIELSRGADALIIDAQYLPEEYPAKRGWGHSTFEQVTALAREAGVRQLLLTHHEPTRSDADVACVEDRARRRFAATRAAREGMVLRLGSRGVRFNEEGLPIMPPAPRTCEGVAMSG